MSETTLSDLAHQVGVVSSTNALWDLSLRFLRERGVTQVSYHIVTPQGGESLPGIRTYGFPEDWVQHYIREGLIKVDPITALAARRTQPFFWREVPLLTRLRPEEWDFMRQLETADFGDGLAMQVYGPNMRSAYVGLGLGHSTSQMSEACVFELKAAAQIAHLRYCELTEDRVALERDLSPREREVLNWIARGKSNATIAQIVGVSRHTVDTLIRRIYDKLEVTDRTTAALRGLGAGLILLDRPPSVT